MFYGPIVCDCLRTTIGFFFCDFDSEKNLLDPLREFPKICSRNSYKVWKRIRNVCCSKKGHSYENVFGFSDQFNTKILLYGTIDCSIRAKVDQ